MTLEEQDQLAKDVNELFRVRAGRRLFVVCGRGAEGGGVVVVEEQVELAKDFRCIVEG